MPSIFALIHLPSRGENGIDHLARRAELPGRGSMTKAEKIIALADEPLSADAEEIVLATSRDLVEHARAAGVDGYSTLTKSELQERFLKAILSDALHQTRQTVETPSSNGQTSSPDHTPNGAARPPESISDPAHSTEHSLADASGKRHHAIQEAARSALDAALKEKRSYVVVESFRPKDKTQPLSIQPAYMQRHADTQLVCEIIIPHTAHRS